MIRKEFLQKIGLETISVVEFAIAEGNTPEVLFIHGAGKATKERYFYLADFLCDHNKSSILFDFSGHGQSSGEILNSSLRKRYNEAYEISGSLSKEKPLTLVATSMGGHVAVKLSQVLKAENLILFCPAAYSARSFELNFNSTFTEEIRKQDSWKSSDVFEILSRFKGNLLIIIGEEDKIIPKGVIESLYECAINAKKKQLLLLPGAPHGLHFWLLENVEHMGSVKNAIVSLLENNSDNSE